MKSTPYKFTHNATSTPPSCIMANLLNNLNNKIPLTAKDKQYIYDNSGHGRGQFPLSGWMFDFKPFMKRYIVNHYGQWACYYAFTKSNIRNNSYTKTGIDEIFEITNIHTL